MQILISISLLGAAIIHFMPLAGILGESRLKKLYGLEFDDPNLLILMQHRAVLFGILGSFLILAIFKEEYRYLAITLTLISAISFAVIALLRGGYNSQIKSVVIADIIAIVLLILALFSINLSSAI